MIGSVLFGHEKGGFTGTEHHKGLVAQDEGGAEFLDTLETYNWLGSEFQNSYSSLTHKHYTCIIRVISDGGVCDAKKTYIDHRRGCL